MNRYFIGLIPPEYLSNYITGVKQHLADNYNSKAALNQPPHITLVPPFELDKSKEENLYQLINSSLKDTYPFLLTLENYGSFKKKVIYMDVVPNNQLNKLASILSEVLQEQGLIKPSEFEYHPHITVAFKDLTKENYELVWKEYKDKKVYFNWDINRVSILKYVDKQWVVLRDISFSHG